MPSREAPRLETHTGCVIGSSASMTAAPDHNRFLIMFTLSAESRGALLALGGNNPNLPNPEKWGPREETWADKPTQEKNREMSRGPETKSSLWLWLDAGGLMIFVFSSRGGRKGGMLTSQWTDWI